MRGLIVLTRQHILLVIFTLLLIGGIAGLIIFEREYATRFFPNVVLGSEHVGGKTFAEVASRIRLVGEALRTTGLQLVLVTDNGTTTITIPERSVGLTPDVVVEYFTLGEYEAAVRAASEYGHTGSLLRRVREQLSLLVSEKIFELPVVMREPALRSLLSRELDGALQKSRDATFVRRGSEVDIAPEASGEHVDMAPVLAGINQALTRLETNRLQLRATREQAQVTAKRLAEIKEFADYVARAMRVEFGYRGEVVHASGATLATWITVRPGPGATLVIKRESVSEFIRKTINERIDDPPRNSRFAMVDGALIETVPGVPGSVASIEAISARLEEIVNERYLGALFVAAPQPAAKEVITLPITFVQKEPFITAATIGRYKIRDRIGTATTSFRGSSVSRKHNIAIGAQRVSGLLIAPGEEFSLVRALGEISEEEGFEKEYVIKGDRSVKEAGGGLCQLATTVFRAALNAGLPITERKNHSYVVGYYGPGLDATIYGPWPDLRFVNDTGEYLLFQMKITGDTVAADFYGASDKRQVVITEPVLSDYTPPPPDRFIPDPDAPWGQMTCTDQARKGLTAAATYAVTYANGRVNEQVFKSVYQPWPKICLVGIKIPGVR